jgi:hypothetical protein
MKETGTAHQNRGEQRCSPYNEEITNDIGYLPISSLPGTLSGSIPVANWRNSPALPHG